MTYTIKASHYYYSGTLHAPEDGPYLDEGSFVAFVARSEAERYLVKVLGATGKMTNGQRYVPGRYVLSHGEYERPDFAVVRASKRVVEEARWPDVDKEILRLKRMKEAA